jgi:hypothetical protein
MPMRTGTIPDRYVLTFEHTPANPFARRIVHKCSIDEAVELIRPSELVRLHTEAGLHVVAVKCLVFFPRRFSFLGQLESFLDCIPSGGRYEVIGRKEGDVFEL